MANSGDVRRANAARTDLPGLIGSDRSVGLVLLDDDHREQPLIEGQVIRVGTDSLVFRSNGIDEEIPLGIISKRVHGDSVKFYGEGRGA